eukprot:TRINITY_DN44503_c0_g1_i2.p1 TRINITY_DN44503_c0_g1~~TRINITY_DN44503_c0_g1_i2.p1  ORF type:complete len:460 (-),score=51.36 TRINITY_DN44503_c0_g1_i2:7-1386(-)
MNVPLYTYTLMTFTMLLTILPIIIFSFFFFFLMIRRPPRSPLSSSSAASDVYKRQIWMGNWIPMQITTIVLLLAVLAQALDALSTAVLAAIIACLVALQAVMSKRLQTVRHRMQQSSDRRLILTSQLLDSIRVMKFLAVEPAFVSRISAEREVELGHALDVMRLRAGGATVVYVLPAIATTAAFLVLVSQRSMIGLADAMVVIGAMTMLRTPVSALPTTMSLCSEAFASLGRIRSFFNHFKRSKNSHVSATCSPTVTGNPVFCKAPGSDNLGSSPSTQSATVRLSECEFVWGEDALSEEREREQGLAEHAMLRRLICRDLVLRKSELCCVTGAVGSGKSSLCEALLGLMPRSKGFCSVVSSVAYCPQIPWLLSGSVRVRVRLGSGLALGRSRRTLCSDQNSSRIGIAAPSVSPSWGRIWSASRVETTVRLGPEALTYPAGRRRGLHWRGRCTGATRPIC